MFSFVGCGSQEDDLTSAENEDTRTYITDEKGDKYLLIDSESLEIIDNDYEIYDAYSEVITRQGLDEADLYYTTVHTTEDGAEAEKITPAEGCTSLNVDFLLVNIKDLNNDGSIKDDASSKTDENGMVNAKDFFKNFSGKLVYDGTVTYECTPYQENLEQTDSNGYTVRSTKAVKLGSGDAARMSLIADVPLEISDWLETYILEKSKNGDASAAQTDGDASAAQTDDDASAARTNDDASITQADDDASKIQANNDAASESKDEKTFYCFFTINGDNYAVDLLKETALLYY